MDVEIDDACLVGAGIACGLGDPIACAALALAAAIDAFEGELDDFSLISATGDFTAPLGGDPPVVIPGTGSSATLQFLGEDLVRATPVSSITLTPTPSGAFPGLGGAVALLSVGGADLTSPPALIPILHWLQTSASLAIDLDLLDELGDVFGDPADIPVFSGNLGTGLDDGLEVDVGTDPLDPDSDDDGIPDGEDVEWLQNSLSGLPNGVFKSAGPGHRTAMLAHLDVVEMLVARGQIGQAIKKLEDLRSRVDGCGATADPDDWIVDCPTQFDVRDLIDLFITNLSS